MDYSPIPNFGAADYKRRRRQAEEAERDRLSRLDYDQRYDLFRERAKSLATSKLLADRLAYLYLGPDLITSIALALDPTARFQFKVDPVVKVQRFRRLPGIPGHNRKVTYRTPNSTRATQTVNGVNSPDFNLQDDTPKGSSVLTAQENIDGFLNDTSYASRKAAAKKAKSKFKSFQGEMELYVPSLQTTPWNYTWRERDNVSINDAPPLTTYHARSIKDHETIVQGVTQRIPKTGHDTWFAGYRAAALGVLSKRSPELIGNCLPTTKRFSLFYNVAEMRELPLLLKTAVQRMRSLRKLIDSMQDPGSLYLEYKFAWESTLRAVKDMLDLPEKIAKQVNYLLSRNGKLTTLHYRTSYTETLSSIPGFVYEIYPYDVVLDSASVRGTHHVQLRCAVNSRIDLPHVDPPKLRDMLFARKMGFDPDPGDLYNLVPWTWLFDWFTGFGEYISCIEALLNDNSLINYGLVSFTSKGQVVSALKLKADGSKATAVYGNPTVTETLKYRPTRDASFFFKYHIRRSVTDLDGVKLTSVPSSLRPGQKAIVTALLTKQSKGRGGNVTGNPSA